MTRRRTPIESAMPLPEAIAPFVLMDSNQAAQILGTTADTLVDWRVDHKGPPYLKLTNGMVRYQLRDLLAWMGTKRVDYAG